MNPRVRRPLLLFAAVALLLTSSPSAQGTFQDLHVFGSGEGSVALGALVQTSDGNLYGTTQSGGGFNHGTIYQVTPSGTVSVVYAFTGTSDGGLPVAGLVADTNGLLYG